LEESFEKIPGYLPQNLKIERAKHVPYSDQPTAQWTHCRGILFIYVKVQEQGVSDVGQLFVRRTVSELQGVTFPHFHIFI